MKAAIGTVLVVDDDRSFLAYFRTALDRADVIVLAAAGGAEGLQMVTQHRPDIVVLDVRMPGSERHGTPVYHATDRQADADRHHDRLLQP